MGVLLEQGVFAGAGVDFAVLVHLSSGQHQHVHSVQHRTGISHGSVQLYLLPTGKVPAIVRSANRPRYFMSRPISNELISQTIAYLVVPILITVSQTTELTYAIYGWISSLSMIVAALLL